MSNVLQNMKYCVFIENYLLYLLHHIAIAKIGYLVKDQFYKYIKQGFMIYLRTDDNPPTHSYKQIY